MKHAVKLLLMILLLTAPGCSKPEPSLVGKWTSEKTSSVIEFNKDSTGIVHLKTPTNQVQSVPFKWEMKGDGKFTVHMSLPGTSEVRSGNGSIQKNGQMVLEDDPFKKTD
jgi:hypothetical protein